MATSETDRRTDRPGEGASQVEKEEEETAANGDLMASWEEGRRGGDPGAISLFPVVVLPKSFTLQRGGRKGGGKGA